MDIYEVIKLRRSVRAYQEKKIDEAILNKILEAVRLAPSAHNAQEYKLIIVKDIERKKALAKAALNQDFIAEAPIIIVAVSLNPSHIMACEIPAFPVDIAIALDHLTLAAAAEGLGTCWIGAFSQEEVKKILNIPEKYKVIALMPLGFPADKPKKKIRKNLKELIKYDSF